MKRKPWIKSTPEGMMYIDTKHPEWKKWFIEQIHKLSKFKIVKS